MQRPQVAVTGVQSLVDNGINELPQSYVRPEQERPSCVDVHSLSDTIPVIDLSRLEGEERAVTLDSIHRACREWGFFQVVNHGVPVSLMQRMKEVAENFFALPLEEKQDFKPQPGRHASAGKFGTSFNPNRDAVLDWRDVVRHYFPVGWEEDAAAWPHNPPFYKETLLAYRDAVTSLAQRLLSLMTENLGLPSGAFEAISREQHVHFVYYPPCPQPQLALGIKSHADSGSVTILQQDEVGGLQVSNNGRWIAVEPIPSSFVINLADAMQVLTNDIYPSVDHRAIVNIHKPRLSLVTFFTPEMSRTLKPLPALVTEQQPAVYGAFTFKEYLQVVFDKGPDGKKALTKFRVDNELPPLLD